MNDFQLITRKNRKNKRICIDSYFANRRLSSEMSKNSEFKIDKFGLFSLLNYFHRNESNYGASDDSEERILEMHITSFLILNNFKEGCYFTKIHSDIFINDGLCVINIDDYTCYAYNKNTRYMELINDLPHINKSSNMRKFDDYLAILLGFPCKLPNNNQVRFRHIVYVRENRKMIVLFEFISLIKHNPNIIVYQFVEGIKLYNRKYNRNFQVYFNCSKINES